MTKCYQYDVSERQWSVLETTFVYVYARHHATWDQVHNCTYTFCSQTVSCDPRVGVRYVRLRVHVRAQTYFIFTCTCLLRKSLVFCVFRVIWGLIVLGAFSFFCWYVFDRLSYLRSHPTSVDVEVIYTDQIPFPAVTICNQNLFRCVIITIVACILIFSQW